MKQKEIMVMTAFGPVPFDAIKDYIDPDASKLIEENRKSIMKEVEEDVPMDIIYYVESLAQKNDWRIEKMSKFLNTLAEINYSSAFQLILKEVALELDKKYKDHIENSEEIYCISLTNGHIFKIDKNKVRNFKNFSAFRTMEDAKLACKITRDFLKYMFKGDK